MVPERLHVAVDLDDVTLKFFEGVLDSFKLEYGVDVEWDGQPWGDQAVAFTKHPLFIESGYRDWWGWLRDREWLWAQFPAVTGAIGGVKRLRAAGYYVEAVTSKPEWAEHNVWKWLGKWRPPFNRVTIVTPPQRKVEYTDADVMVDDKFDTCMDFVKADRLAVLFKRAGRESIIPEASLHIAANWQQVILAVQSHDRYLNGVKA